MRLTVEVPLVGDGGRAKENQDPVTQHNVRVESFYSAFNGVYLGLVLFGAPIVAVAGVHANPLELTILVSSYPVGVFFGPLWAILGRRWGMKQLVIRASILANLPLFAMFWVDHSLVFTALICFCLLMTSAMRMGQSSLYRAMYPREVRGRVLGRLTFWMYLTMVPTILIAGWLLDKSRDMYQIIYPVAGLCGLMACLFYSMIHLQWSRKPTRERSSILSRVRGVEHLLARDRTYFFFLIAFFLSGSSFFMSSHVVLLLISNDARFSFTAFDLALWLCTVPQLLLALTSPLWGHVLDRIGILRCRLVISILMTAYLASYFGGIMTGIPAFIFIGSIFQGVSNGGGQLTWWLASSHFAPRPEDVPMYNGIHFLLNGIRGLVMPWVGSVLLILMEPWAVLVATLVSLASIPVVVHSLHVNDEQNPKPLGHAPEELESGNGAPKPQVVTEVAKS